MKMKTLLFLFCLSAFSMNCYAQRKIVNTAMKGTITPSNYFVKVPFRYEGRHLFIEVVINGEVHNFIVDTGASFCVIDLNQIENLHYKKVKQIKISGSSFGKHKTQLIEIESLSISNLEFTDFGAFLMDLSFINEQYPCSKDKPISGIIGASLLRKMNIQIDYRNQVITMTDDFSKLHVPDEALRCEMASKNVGLPLVNVTINGIDKTFIIDTGSSGKITTGLAFKNELDRSTTEAKIISLKKVDKSKEEYLNFYANIQQMNVCGIEFQNQILSMQKGVSSLIGNEFLENYNVSFDWEKNTIILEDLIKPIQSQLVDFELRLDLSSASKKIEIFGVYNHETSAINDSIGTEIVVIDGIDISDFSFEELCGFWNVEWVEIQLKEHVIIETATHKIDLHKINYFE